MEYEEPFRSIIVTKFTPNLSLFFRPPSKEELAARTPQVIKCDEANREVTLTQHSNGKQFGRTYHFDKIFAPDTTQQRLYDSAIAPIVDEVLQGFNCTIFAYGQTGTGKTHTMTGDICDAKDLAAGAGVIPRAVSQIFNYLESIGGSSEYTVKCCFLELYNEEITDLLTPNSPTDAPKVRILEDRTGVVMQGLEEPHVKTAADIFTLLETGNARRRTAETLLNKQSSRSHSVFIVTVSVREVLAEGEEVIRVGKLYLVDLAGSENVSRSGAVDQRAKEAGNINKSLLTLGRVITALVEGQVHVPYRDSKLTRLLRDSLGGRTKTCIIATIAPTVQCQEETLSTLDYAHRAKNIKNKPEVNQKISKTTHLKELAVEIARLKAELVATRAKNGVYLPPEQYEEECEERRRLGARLEELEEETSTAATRHEEEKAALVSQWEGRVAEVRGELADTRAQLDDTRQELEAAKTAIAERDFMLEAHRKAESALAGHAQSLNAELAAAAADVAHLFRRVDAKNELEGANLQLVNDLKQAAVERLATLEAAVAAAAGAQAERFTAARQTLSEIMQRKEVSAQALGHQMLGLQEVINGLAAVAESGASALAAAGSAALDGIGEQHAEFLKVAQNAAVEASAALKETYAALSNSTSEEKAALEALMAGQVAASEAVHSATQTIVAAVQESLTAAQAQAEKATAAVAESLTARAAEAEALHADFAAAARKEQETIVAQLSALISGFVDRAEGQVQSAVNDMKSNLSNDQKNLQSQLGAMSASAGASLSQLAANAAAAQAAQEAAVADLHAHGGKMAAALEETVSNAAEVENVVRQHAEAAASGLAKHGKAVAAATKKEGKALAAVAEKQSKNLTVATEKASEILTETHTALEKELAADKEAVPSLDGTIEQSAEALATFATEQSAGLGGLCAHVERVVTKEYAVDADKHDVPAVRKRKVPSRSQIDALRAPTEESLLRKFRTATGCDEFQCSAEMLDVEAELETEEEELQREEPSPEAEMETEELQGEENVDPTTMEPAVEASALERSSSGEQREPLSPSGVGKKRSRSKSNDQEFHPSPSKLRAAFARGERRRRGTRQTAAE